MIKFLGWLRLLFRAARFLPLSPRGASGEGVGERGAWLLAASAHREQDGPPLPNPLLPRRKEREKNVAISISRVLEAASKTWIVLAAPCLALLLGGCASPKTCTALRPFVFQQDTFAFTNETAWDYHIDPVTGKTTHTRTQPPPSYSHHCFVVARAALQFFHHARFDTNQPVAAEATYRRLVQRAVSLSAQTELSDAERIVIPGYANLFAFSQAQARVLKANCGGAWQSYFQRGHWRMIFPLTRHHQEKMADRLLKSVKQNVPAVVHVVRFPQLSINHAVLLFAAQESAVEIQFTAYDPNNPVKPAPLIFDRSQRRFVFPANPYFAGGRVDVYQVYGAWNY
jgi:hypothetical protein